MRRIKSIFPIDTLEKVYNSLVQCYFEYCSPLWDNWENYSKKSYKDFNLVLIGFLLVPIMIFVPLI